MAAVMVAAEDTWSRIEALPEQGQQTAKERAVTRFNAAAEGVALELPEPGDGTYLKYSDYKDECQAKEIPMKDRMSGEEFLYEHWDIYLDAEILFLPDLGKLDLSLVNKLYYDWRKKGGKPPTELVPDVGERVAKDIENPDREALREAGRIRSSLQRRGKKIREP